jgi:hypothetical protein
MKAGFSTGCFRIKPPPFALSISEKQKMAAVSMSFVNGSLRFSEGTEKGRMNRIFSVGDFVI